MVPVEYEGQLTADDVVFAYFTLFRRQRVAGPANLLNFLFWLSLTFTLLLMQGWLRLLPLFIGLLAFLSHDLNRREASKLARRLYEEHPGLQSHFASRFDDTGFRTQSDLFQDFRTWKAFQIWRETSDYFLISESKGALPRIIPKRLLKHPGDIDNLRGMLAAYIPVSVPPSATGK